MADDDARYEFKDVRAIRGTEARTIAKWQKDGWEFVTQSQGTLRTEMNFRRVKPKTPWRLMAVAGGLIVTIVIVGVAVGSQGGGGTPESTTPPTEAAVVPSEQPSEEPIQEPEESVPAETYAYQGPQYEIVTVDENMGPAGLNQYWVYTSKFDYSTDAFKDQVKMIITDIAHDENTTKLIVEVVTDKEIIEAESASTIASFTEEHGVDYFRDVIAPKEESDWVASYTGGFDADAGQPSESADAFEVIWMPGAAPEFEKWRPETRG